MAIEIEWGGLHTVISGGQTGADQGGLLAAWRADVKTGGTAPTSYKTAIGFNPLLEVLGLTQAGDYVTRTRRNILDSDATVIIANDLASVGSKLARRILKEAKKPYIEFDVSATVQLARLGPAAGSQPVLEEVVKFGQALATFLQTHQVQVLNVAGNRELPSDGTLGGTMIMTSITDWIVGLALELLDLEDKLIRKA